MNANILMTTHGNRDFLFVAIRIIRIISILV